MSSVASQAEDELQRARVELSKTIAVLRKTREELLCNASNLQHILSINMALCERIRAHGTAPPGGCGAPDPNTLTSREIEVLLLACDGLQRKEIAARLRISPKTVEFHRQKIADRAGLKTTASMVRYAIRMGLLCP